MFINQQNRIDGTRLTVWDVYLYSRQGDLREVIAHDYGITEEQVQVALDFIDANRDHVEKVHQQIEERNTRRCDPEVLTRIDQGGPAFDAWVDTMRERLRSRMESRNGASHPGGSQSGGTSATAIEPSLAHAGVDRILE